MGRGAGLGGTAGPGGRRASPGPGGDGGLGKDRPPRASTPRPRPAAPESRCSPTRPEGAEIGDPQGAYLQGPGPHGEPPPPAASRAPQATPAGGRGNLTPLLCAGVAAVRQSLAGPGFQDIHPPCGRCCRGAAASGGRGSGRPSFLWAEPSRLLLGGIGNPTSFAAPEPRWSRVGVANPKVKRRRELPTTRRCRLLCRPRSAPGEFTV